MNQTPDQLQADLMADKAAFPVLSASELAECTEFGTRCSFAPGEEIFGAGSQSRPNGGALAEAHPRNIRDIPFRAD